MKILFKIIIGFLIVILLGKFLFWMNYDIPIERNGVLYILALILVMSYRSILTYFIAWWLILMPIGHAILYKHLNDFSIFQFGDYLYIYFVDRIDSKVASIMFIHSVHYFYFFLIALFILPPTIKFYWRRAI
jgi:hypothetical protein